MTFVFLKIGAWILVLVILWLARRLPLHLVRLLFSDRGPRTDVAFMNRRELFQSGGWFLGLGSLLLAAAASVMIVSGNAFSESAPLLYLFFVLMFPGFMGLGGGIYLCFRGLIRRPTPPLTGPDTPIDPR
jgi:hypothetical protein